MNAVVVDASEEEPLPGYRKKMKAFAKKHPSLGYDPFTDFKDLIPSVKIAKGKSAGTVIEIVAHGSPLYHHDIGSVYLAPFAAALRKVIPSSSRTTVYLTGCNTGLSEGGYCIAEELANALGDVTVCGAAGWVMEGAAITGDAVTAAVFDGQSYGGARDDVHPTCWNCFPARRVVSGASPAGAPRPPLKPMPSIEPGLIHEAIARALATPRARLLAPLLIGPDVRGVVELDHGPMAYEILHHGAILRDALTRETFDFPQGPELLERLQIRR